MLPMEAFSDHIRLAFYQYSWLDKFCHFTLFLVLTSLVYFTFDERKINVFEYMFGFALIFEGLQIFAERSVSISDGLANVSGVLAIFLIAKIYSKNQNKKLACIAS